MASRGLVSNRMAPRRTRRGKSTFSPRFSASPSMAGRNRGLWSCRIPLEHLGARVFPDMFSLAQAHEAFSDDGKLRDAKRQKWFEGTVDCFIESVEAAKHYPTMKSQWIEFLGERPNPATERVEVSEIQPV